MAFIIADGVGDTTTTASTGDLTVSGSAPTTYPSLRTFSAVCAVGDTFYCRVGHQTLAEWELGLYTYSALNTLTRTQIIGSSNANALVNFSAGTKDVVLIHPAQAIKDTRFAMAAVFAAAFGGL